ncbi:MAG: DNA adenine methylase [Desulfovibrio sp.]
MSITRPVLRYHGGKWKLAPWIISHMPPHVSYVEPYGGAASVLLRKQRAGLEVYNDLYDDVVNVFRVLRDPALAERLRLACELTPFSRSELVAALVPSGDAVERARQTIVRSFFGRVAEGIEGSRPRTFRLYRDGYSVARGWAAWPECIPAFVERLRGVTIEQMDALGLIERYDSADALLFVDPPYVHETRTDIKAKRGAYRHEMTDTDHEDLARSLHGVQGMVLLSGYGSPLYDDLYAGWTRVTRSAYADKASPRTEILWMNKSAAERCPRLGLLAVCE